jgi:hypothetical protein
VEYIILEFSIVSVGTILFGGIGESVYSLGNDSSVTIILLVSLSFIRIFLQLYHQPYYYSINIIYYSIEISHFQYTISFIFHILNSYLHQFHWQEYIDSFLLPHFFSYFVLHNQGMKEINKSYRLLPN